MERVEELVKSLIVSIGVAGNQVAFHNTHNALDNSLTIAEFGELVNTLEDHPAFKVVDEKKTAKMETL